MGNLISIISAVLIDVKISNIRQIKKYKEFCQKENDIKEEGKINGYCKGNKKC